MDILERLRREASSWPLGEEPLAVLLCEEAVKEIERLRAENEELRAADRDHLSARNGMEKRLLAEIERLQERR